MSAELHAAAVHALLEAVVRVYDVEAPQKPDLPYALLFVPGGALLRVALAPVSSKRDIEFQVTSVGLTEDGMRSVQDRAATALVDRRPAVAGRQTSPIWQVPGAGDLPRVDRDVTPHRLYVVDRFAFSSVPLPSP